MNAERPRGRNRGVDYLVTGLEALTALAALAYVASGDVVMLIVWEAIAAGYLLGCCCNLGREPRRLRFYCVINAMCLCCQAVSNTRLTITASGFG